jgi:ABC-type sugar transport system substrate-binding protein
MEKSGLSLIKILEVFMKKKLYVIAVPVIILLALAGCGKKDDAAKSGKVKIAYIVKAMTDQFWIDMRKGAEDAANEFNVDLSFQAPDKETDVERQVQMMENAIISKADAIILSAASSTALNPTIVKANNAKIPVILVNDTIDEANLKTEGGFVETYVGIDQYKSAALAGTYAADNLPGGKILLLEGIAGVDAHDQRLNGFKDQVAGKPGFEIVASLAAHCDRNEAYNVMQDVITRYPDVNLVWAINAEMGQGAIRAIEEAKKTGITVFDFDNSKDDREAIKAGTLAGSIDQYPAVQARASIQACLDALAGKKLPAHTETKAELVTKVNVK